jgi:hypothetical protein
MAVTEWGTHYNRGRPHSSLGPGLPEPTQDSVPAGGHRHKLPTGFRVAKTPVLGGLHHKYCLVKEAAQPRGSFLRTTALYPRRRE